jgi:hypothetical protein
MIIIKDNEKKKFNDDVPGIIFFLIKTLLHSITIATYRTTSQ